MFIDISHTTFTIQSGNVTPTAIFLDNYFNHISLHVELAFDPIYKNVGAMHLRAFESLVEPVLIQSQFQFIQVLCGCILITAQKSSCSLWLDNEKYYYEDGKPVARAPNSRAASLQSAFSENAAPFRGQQPVAVAQLSQEETMLVVRRDMRDLPRHRDAPLLTSPRQMYSDNAFFRTA